MHTLELLTAKLPDGWTCEPSGDLFVEVYPQTAQLPEQGWKIRCNTTCIEKLDTLILRVADEICFRERIPMKVVNGRQSMYDLHAKFTDFTIAGKSLTLYPGNNPKDFVYIIEKTERLMKTLSVEPCAQPWSDKIFASNVSYRYGSYVHGQFFLRVGTLRVPDRRDAFVLPPGINDPFDDTTTSADPSESEPGAVRIQGCDITECLYRNWGGSVYIGNSGSEEVILKEARPHARIACEILSTDLLKNEFKVLTTLAGITDIAPRPIDLFQKSGHFFLLMSRLAGFTLSEWKPHNEPSPKRIVDIAGKIAEKILELHASGSAHLDISASNIIVGEEDVSVSLIDFENAILNASDAALAEDSKQFAALLHWLAVDGVTSGYIEAIHLGKQGASMTHIFESLVLCQPSVEG